MDKQNDTEPEEEYQTRTIMVSGGEIYDEDFYSSPFTFEEALINGKPITGDFTVECETWTIDNDRQLEINI